MQYETRKAYSYIRFSTPDQAKGDSYRRQTEAAKRYCQLNGLQWANTSEYLFFDKGRSAFKGKNLDDNSELSRFLSYINNGTILPGSVLIVESLDRLSRDRITEALPRFLDILKSGVDIYTSIDEKLYTQDVHDFDLLFSIIHMSRAHSESSIKGERVSKAWKQKQTEAREHKKPLGKACPYWLTFDGNAYEPIVERAEIVQRIFKLAVEGYGQGAIAKILNEYKVPVFGSDKRNKNGLWASSSTGKILVNRALLGEYQPTGLVNGIRRAIGEPVVNFYPAIISDDEFYQAQAARNTRKISKATKTTQNFNIWQGIAKCSSCNESMHLVNKGTPPKGGKYLRCYGAAKGACKSKLVPLGPSERIYMEILAKVDSLSLVQDSQSKIAKEIAVIDVRFASVKGRLAEIERQLISLDLDIPQAVVLSIAKLEREAKELTAKSAELKQQAQREKIINKKEFFSKLDMVTYEARARANYLLKTLDVTVTIGREDGCTLYAVASNDHLNFFVVQTGDAVDFIPLGEKALETIYDQGDGAGHSAIRETMKARLSEIGKALARDSVLVELLRSIKATEVSNVEQCPKQN
ncbi:recombinase family protein [Pseudomonas psychrophila]|uniref:recombinase family protein n=1 Tax=Pseudomonas psychrophila TaxID=122355 RepID=UPI000356EDB7|nr:recombinase family protein [Pseudomonas psychrophila]EPJ92145.1 recombinase-related protein [Pseudomonas psychrophila]